MQRLYWNTVNDLLKEMLEKTMTNAAFEKFILVGGTSLSLQLGHRLSVDIDLFTDAEYGSIDFKQIGNFFKTNYTYTSAVDGQAGPGTSYFAGISRNQAVKVDIFYTDSFIRPPAVTEGIRLASLEDIIAMKLDIVARGGRKKDFWDLHELADIHPIENMIGFHKERYPYGHDEPQLRKMLLDYSVADDDFDPQCLKGKHWELIKLDFFDLLKN